MDFLFGEGQNGLRFMLAFVGVLAVMGLTAWLVRRFGSDRLGAGSARGRQPRLAVVDAASVDGRRRLVLIRRDNVEHLLMIGGPTDLVIEPTIVRAAPPREVAPPRPAADHDVLPRAVPLGEGSMWPLQPDAPPQRPQRSAPTVEEPASRYGAGSARHTEPIPARFNEPASRHAEVPPRSAEPPPFSEVASPPRHARTADPLAGLAAELARQGPSSPPLRIAREREEEREAELERPEATAADPPDSSDADQNLAEMAHRLESALRRSPKPESAEPEPPRNPPAAEPRPLRAETRPPRDARAGAPKSSLYDNLEREMTSLLGRPNKA
jgi:hypothetical protein